LSVRSGVGQDESANFENLLLEIESKSKDLGISSFGTTATTMEEVFLKYVSRNIRRNETLLRYLHTLNIIIEWWYCVCSNLKKNDKVITIKVVGMLISVEYK
jgi:hypothetical protein